MTLWKTKQEQLDELRQALEKSQREAESLTQRALESRINTQLPSIVAYKIDNGYLVQVHPARSPGDAAHIEGRRGGFHYCADHKAIADYIVTCNVREKLNIPSQGDMFVHSDMLTIKTPNPVFRITTT